ncbi:hypothetical protein V1477_018371 [Vespula maculifrons]|uniref:Uncharacterized protein n=1 Tax=Vespula maculifrons TaxID=7453 RepID=A0ABD2AZ93_VESMC
MERNREEEVEVEREREEGEAGAYQRFGLVRVPRLSLNYPGSPFGSRRQRAKVRRNFPDEWIVLLGGERVRIGAALAIACRQRCIGDTAGVESPN